MPSQSLRSAASLILSVALSAGIGAMLARAQEAQDPQVLARQIEQFAQAGKYTDALALQRRVAADTEKAETATAGAPGDKTAGELVSVAWYALLARRFNEALAASDRAHLLAPTDLAAEINRAHALLFTGRLREARAIYFAHKGRPMSLTNDQMWEDVIADDVAALTKDGIQSPILAHINAKLGGKSSAIDIDLTELRERIKELDRTGSYKEAEASANKYVTLVRERYTENHPKFATAIYWQAYTFESQRRYAEAEPLFKRALAIDEKTLGPDHQDVGEVLSNLAILYVAQGRYAEAEPLFKRAVLIREKVLGPDDISVAASLKNLTELYAIQNRYAEAELDGRRALAILEKKLGLEHPSLAAPLFELALVFKNLNRSAEAEPLVKRSLAIQEKALGPDHPDVATTLDYLAGVYQSLARYADAEPLLKRVLAIREHTPGADLEVASALQNLALLYMVQGHFGDAEPLFKQGLAIREKVLGPNNSDVAAALNGIASAYVLGGHFDEAEPLLKRSLAIQEKLLGPDHPDVASALYFLATQYQNQSRSAEAEPLLKRALSVKEKFLGPDSIDVGYVLNNLAAVYMFEDRYGEAEPLVKRSLAIFEKALGPDNRVVATNLNNLAFIYDGQNRLAEAEPIYKRALSIKENALGPDHFEVGTVLNNLALLDVKQGRLAEAEPLYQRALAIKEKALGPDHPDVGSTLNNFAGLYLARRDWARAIDFGRRSTAVLIRRTQRGTDTVGQALTGKRPGDAQQLSKAFFRLIKASNGLVSDAGNTDVGLPVEMFQMAQWALASDAAQSLSQMAARAAKGDAGLGTLIRERQDLVVEWEKRDQDRSAAVAQTPDKRDRQAEAENIARLDAIDGRIASIDKRLAANFPDYAAFANPAPASIADIQAVLHPDEALVMFLDTTEDPPLPEETFIWVVTKTDTRWVRSELGTPELSREVYALRCGLDYDGAWRTADSSCAPLLATSYGSLDYRSGKPLPFDLARGNKLYRTLFGQIEDLIKNKHLLIVPSGPLTQLPFQVLVKSLPRDVSAVERTRDVTRLGTQFANLSVEERERLRLNADNGVRIVSVMPDTAAASVDLKPEDIVLSLDGVKITTAQQLFEAIQSRAPGTSVQIGILRGDSERVIAVTLGASTIREWIPRFLANGEGKNIDWLIRDHTITVLPSVYSLKALRQLAKQSGASEPYIGFGNPLLDGEPTRFKEDAEAAKLAREKRCDPTLRGRVASLLGMRGGTRAMTRSGGGVDVTDVRTWAPLPETADELCDVALDLGVNPQTHLYLGAKATEAEVKRLSAEGALAKYRIVHFATHGAVAGQVSRTVEPGLLLTPPEKASEMDDGYLSASEAAALKLDADWVILSACNTAAGAAKGAEALSGLARAFFYAGDRSLLVSHWEVASESTVKLITKAVDELKRYPKIGRAEALRRSMLSMIDSGKDYEAHPAFWAPFVLVGEGGAAR